MGIDVESTKSGEVIVMSNGFPKKSFKFDSVFGPNASQGDLWHPLHTRLAGNLISQMTCFLFFLFLI